MSGAPCEQISRILSGKGKTFFRKVEEEKVRLHLLVLVWTDIGRKIKKLIINMTRRDRW